MKFSIVCFFRIVVVQLMVYMFVCIHTHWRSNAIYWKKGNTNSKHNGYLWFLYVFYICICWLGRHCSWCKNIYICFTQQWLKFSWRFLKVKFCACNKCFSCFIFKFLITHLHYMNRKIFSSGCWIPSNKKIFETL